MKRLSIFFAALMACTLSFAAEVTDVLKASMFKATETTYTEFSNVEATSGTVYAGQNAMTENGGIQLRSKKSNSGIVSTKSVGTVKSVAITVESGNKTLDIYGSKTAYTAATDLYNSKTQGTKLGSLSKTGTLDITGDYAYIGVRSNNGTIYLTDITIVWNSAADPDAIDKPTFTPADGDFVGSVEVTLAAGEGLDIYYTLDGTDPTTASTKYTAPFTLTETKTVKAIAYNATTKKASEVAEKTYTAQKLMTCADANAAKDGDAIFLNEVTVVYADGANIYVADATGTTLVYSKAFNTLKAGQAVKGIKGSMKIYYDIPEIIPSVALADLNITEGGIVPDPEAVTAVPTMNDINKYVRLDKVTVSAATWTSEENQSTADRTLVGKFLGEDITLYNTFKIDLTFAAGDYEVIGFVTCYKSNPQIAVVSAKPAQSVGTSVVMDGIRADVAVEKIVRNGQVFIIRDGNIYNLMGQVVE